ncbi:MAG: hypothetical protein SGPRY_005386, partial [Prymnesium sp.]
PGSADVKAARQAAAVFERSLTDAPSLPPFSYEAHTASPAAIVNELRARGFTAARSAFDGDGAKAGGKRVRTNAPERVRREVGLGPSRSGAAGQHEQHM